MIRWEAFSVTVTVTVTWLRMDLCTVLGAHVAWGTRIIILIRK
jgi:hypothetical protein